MAKERSYQQAIADLEYLDKSLNARDWEGLSLLDCDGNPIDHLGFSMPYDTSRPFPKTPFGLKKGPLPLSGKPILPRDGLRILDAIVFSGWYACPKVESTTDHEDHFAMDINSSLTPWASPSTPLPSSSIQGYSSRPSDGKDDSDLGTSSYRKHSTINDKEEEQIDIQCRQMWDLIRSYHVMRDKTRKSAYYLQEDDAEANRLLAPMYKAAGDNFALKPCQRDGIGMMLHFERSEYRGCLLGDEMGLGKTVQLLALYLLNPMEKPMLIVVPAAIISNWVSEIKKLLDLPDEHVFVFKGGNATSDTLRKKRIVITSYTRLQMEQRLLDESLLDFNHLRRDAGATHRPDPKSTSTEPRPDILINPHRRELPLFGTSWGRIVLDGGHYIRNQSTITFRAAMSLTGTTRIVETGTPFSNEYTDVETIFKFLRKK